MVRTIIELLLVIALIVNIVFSSRKIDKGFEYNDQLLETIDSLNLELNAIKSTKDSLQCKLDSSIVNVEVIEHWYEKKFIDITNQSISSDVQFFTNYISKTCK